MYIHIYTCILYICNNNALGTIYSKPEESDYNYKIFIYNSPMRNIIFITCT